MDKELIEAIERGNKILCQKYQDWLKKQPKESDIYEIINDEDAEPRQKYFEVVSVIAAVFPVIWT